MNKCLTILLTVGLIIACCTLSPALAYNLSGTVTDILGNPLGGVTITFSTTSQTAITDDTGKWNATGFSGEVVVTPCKDDYLFIPANTTLTAESTMVDFYYTRIVTFEDANLEQAIRKQIKKPTGALFPEDLLRVYFLNCEDGGISSLAGIEYLPNLKSLNILKNTFSDLSPLEHLRNLEYLYFRESLCTDFSPLSNLTNLRDLNIGVTRITDVTPFKNLTNLESLCLWGCQVSDITPLSGLKKLRQLNLGGNENIENLDILANFEKLEYLNISKTKVNDLSVLSNCPALNTLFMQSTPVTDISVLFTLPQLRILGIEGV